MKKYHIIIWGLGTMVDIQLQIEYIIRQTNIVNNQLANIKIILLQVKEIYKLQVGEDIYSISEELQNVIHRDMERQVNYI